MFLICNLVVGMVVAYVAGYKQGQEDLRRKR